VRDLRELFWAGSSSAHILRLISPGRGSKSCVAIEANIAKLPSVPRQILKDIPRPPNSASRDD
jgi:hypothetical protein